MKTFRLNGLTAITAERPRWSGAGTEAVTSGSERSEDGSVARLISHPLGRNARGLSVTIHDIQSLVAQRFGVTVLDLVSDRRGRAQARPRQVAMWLARHTTTHSLPAIGRAFGDRDHSTVIQAIRRVEERMAADVGFSRTVWDLLRVVDPVGSVEISRLRMRRAAA